MDIFSLLNSASPAPATPAPVQPPASPSPTYEDFVKNLVAARAAQASAAPSSLWNWLSGRQVDAAKAGAMSDAPAVWDAYKSAQSASRNAQLGTAASLASQGAMADTTIDPNNIEAAIPDIQKSLAGFFAPGAQPTNGDPLVAQRAFYDRMGNMLLRMPGGAAVAKEMFALRDKGLPENTTSVRGVPVDGVSGAPLTGSVGAVKASQVEPTKRMETGYDIHKAQVQQGLNIGEHAANADKDASLDLVDGIDLKTGLPVTRTRADVVANGGQVKSNPFFEGQQAEMKPLRESAESAEQGLTLAQQLVSAANGLFTGKGASTFQDVRKLALTAGELTGAKPSDAILNDASKFEQLKFASQQLVAKASHDLSPRIAQNIYAQIEAVKPGDRSSIQGLRDIIVKQIVPALSRSKAIYQGTARYYQQNPFKNDAQTVVPGQNPSENFSVKDIHSAQPGDFYIDPTSGNLRQRPLN